MFKRLDSEVETGLQGERAAVLIHFRHNRGIVGAIDHNGDIFMVLGGGAHHCRATDIDIFHRLFTGTLRARHCGCKGVQVDDHHVDWGNVMLAHNGVIDIAPAQDPAMHFGMQRFNPPVHHFGKARIVGHFGDR